MYGLYLLKIGGGYMGGRFLTPPFFVGAILVGRWLRTVGRAWVAPAFLLGVFVLALQSHTLSALSPSTYNMRTTDGNELDIVDERGQWYPRTGLLASGRDIPAFGAVETLLDIRLSPQDPEIFLDGKVGLDGIVAGPGVHLVDPMLCDPLMMRLPVWDLNDWRIGHFMRRVPQGYLESLVSGDNRIDDPGLARAYEDLRLATRGGLFDPKRAKAIWSLAFGAGKRGLKSYVESGYRSPHTVVVSAQDLPRKVEAGARLWSDSSRVVTAGGVRVALPRISHSTQVTLGVGALAEYLLVIQKEGAELGRLELSAGESEKLFPGLIPLEVEIPSQVADSGWDAIEIHPLRNRRSGIHCLASMEGY
jgi:arabinofuranosyltransferase